MALDLTPLHWDAQHVPPQGHGAAVALLTTQVRKAALTLIIFLLAQKCCRDMVRRVQEEHGKLDILVNK